MRGWNQAIPTESRNMAWNPWYGNRSIALTPYPDLHEQLTLSPAFVPALKISRLQKWNFFKGRASILLPTDQGMPRIEVIEETDF